MACFCRRNRYRIVQWVPKLTQLEQLFSCSLVELGEDTSPATGAPLASQPRNLSRTRTRTTVERRYILDFLPRFKTRRFRQKSWPTLLCISCFAARTDLHVYSFTPIVLPSTFGLLFARVCGESFVCETPHLCTSFKRARHEQDMPLRTLWTDTAAYR
jgi:hypothetical protein